MKNPHGVEPTRFMKKKESQYAIECHPKLGPIFGSFSWAFYFDLHIDDKCNKEYSCYIDNNGTNAHECHPEYQSSLFVGTAGSDECNRFSVLDYEVFTPE